MDKFIRLLEFSSHQFFSVLSFFSSFRKKQHPLLRLILIAGEKKNATHISYISFPTTREKKRNFKNELLIYLYFLFALILIKYIFFFFSAYSMRKDEKKKKLPFFLFCVPSFFLCTRVREKHPSTLRHFFFLELVRSYSVKSKFLYFSSTRAHTWNKKTR